MVYTEDNYEWFLALNKPSFQPEPWVFMVAWAILFILIATAAILILFAPKDKRKNCNVIVVTFIINALLHSLWSLLFFGLHQILLALIELPFLLASTMILIWCSYKVNKTASYLLIPYLLWLLYATVLMANFYFIN